jgi:multidrug efflux pump subunit AcrA (membrane-fusion protein)
MPLENSVDNSRYARERLIANIELRSDEVQELITSNPGWLVRQGISIFFIVLVGVIAGAFFIRYPEIVKTSVRLTSANPPRAVLARQEGKLIRLMAKDNQMVKKNEVLGFIESTASHEEVIELSGILDTLQRFMNTDEVERIPGYLNKTFDNLGEMQAQFQTFMQGYNQFKQSLSNGFFLSRKAMLRRDLGNLQRQRENLLEQKVIYEKDYALSEEEYRRQKKLAEEKVIAPIEESREESKLNNKKLPMSQLASSLISNEQQQNDKQKEMLDLDRQILEQKSVFQQALNTLLSSVDDWKRRYLIIAPIEGKILFNSYVQENQYVRANQEMCYISPGDAAFFGEMFISQFNLGKVKNGQKVLLKFPSYPFQEYGSVDAQIEHIADIPRDSGYLARVILPKGLVTSFHKNIFFRNGLVAEGEIITDDMRLAERMFYNFRKVLQSTN